jgi:hypothetical protein
VVIPVGFAVVRFAGTPVSAGGLWLRRWRHRQFTHSRLTLVSRIGVRVVVVEDEPVTMAQKVEQIAPSPERITQRDDGKSIVWATVQSGVVHWHISYSLVGPAGLEPATKEL